MSYDYKKIKYKTYSIQLDRVKDRDIIEFIEGLKDREIGIGPKCIIVEAIRTVRELLTVIPGGDSQ